jgi:anion-transporting  ArsA/GET3 family ATPase
MPAPGASAGEGLRARLAEKRICICAGPGGVGKTTISAALALGLAIEGRKVAVLTIDPARRLAGALGLRGSHLPASAAPGEPVRVPAALLEEAGIELSGQLWAVTLEARGTFDRLVDELAPDPRARAAVRANRVYRELIAGESGSQEIAAVAELYALARSERFDAIVLDTPPAAHAIDFLEAPAKLTAFLESRAIALFLAAAGIQEPGQESAAVSRARSVARALPRAIGTRALSSATGILLSLFARATGLEVVGELADFLRIVALAGDPLRARAIAVQELLRGPDATILIVTTPESAPAREARALHERLLDLGLPYGGLIVNRLHSDRALVVSDRRLRAILEQVAGAQLGERLAANLADFAQLAQRDSAVLESLRSALQERAPVCVPQVEGEVEDLRALGSLAQILLGNNRS